MKDYKQTTRDIFRKRDEYLARRKKRIAYIEKGVSIMSITGILVALGLCTSMSSSIAPVPQDEPHEIDINSGISTVTSQTAQTAKFLQTARTSQNSTSILTSTGLTSTSADMTSNSSSDVTSDTAASTAAASSAVRSVLTSTDEIVTILTSTGTDSTESSTTISSDTSETTLSTSSTAETSATAATESTSSTESVDSTVEDDGIYTYGPTINDDVQIGVALREKGTLSDTVYIDSAELENGDYTFKASACLETDDSLIDMWHFHSYWDAIDETGMETPYIITDNIVTYREKWNDDRINKILEEVEVSQTSYITGAGMIGDPYAAGPGKIYIEDQYTGEPVFYDLTINEETGVATVDVPRLTGYNLYTLTIHHYDPETPYGEPIWREQKKMSIHCLSGFSEAWTTENVNGFNEMGYFDVIIDQDTPHGIYYLQLQNAYMHGGGLKAVTTNVNSEGNDESYWLKIVVGDSADTAYDVNQDGTVGVDDATEVLSIYAETAAGTNSDIQIQQTANVNADVDGDGIVTLSDATAILTKYAEKAAGV